MRLIAGLALLLLVLAGAGRASADERIQSFGSRILVEPSGIIDVTETILVTVEGDIIKRGLLRDIPTRYEDRHGLAVTVDLDVISVTRDGEEEPFAVERLANGKRIRTGDKDVFLPRRPTTFVIRYRASREIGFFEGYDELYWNVTGSQWTFPIDRASVEIVLPEGATVGQNAAYTGRPGDQGQDFRVDMASGRIYRASTTRTLDPGEGFTVAVAFPKGFVAPPSETRKALWFLGDNSSIIIAWLGVAAVGWFYWRAWNRLGRDPAPGLVVPLFRPPDGLSPAATRYVREQGFDDKVFSAALIGLAVKGRMTISEGDLGYTLAPQPGPGTRVPAPLSRGESALLVSLGSSPVALVQSNHARVGAARKSLSRALDDEYKGVAFNLNRGWVVAGAGLSIATLALAYAFASEDVATAGFGAMFFLFWWGIVLAAARAAVARLLAARGFGVVTGLFGLVFLVPFFLAGVALPTLGVVFGSLSFSMIAAVAAAVVLAALNGLFFFLMAAPTAAGRALLDKIEGFRLYLATTEEERLNVLNPPERTPELFERMLPYAIALDCTHEWSAKFTGVLAAAGIAAPSWYSGTNWDPSRPAGFASGLGDGLARSTAAASSPPGSSSGSGGGGSSGGGGGGGGGSGW